MLGQSVNICNPYDLLVFSLFSGKGRGMKEEKMVKKGSFGVTWSGDLVVIEFWSDERYAGEGRQVNRKVSRGGKFRIGKGKVGK